MTIEIGLVKWDSVQKEASKASPLFAKLFDNLVRDKNPELLTIKASYGESIAEEGEFCWAKFQRVSRIPPEKLSVFQYSRIPLCFVRSKSFEVWTPRLRAKTVMSIPNMIAYGGDFIGLFETTTPRNRTPYHINAGVRTIFVGPKITNVRNADVAFDAGIEDYKDLRDLEHHWSLLNYIITEHRLSESWEAELLVFGSDVFPWLIRPDELKNPLLHQEADQLMVHYFLGIANEQHGNALERRTIPTGKVLGTYAECAAAHLRSIMKGHSPAICPVRRSDNDLLPAGKLAQHFDKDGNNLHPRNTHDFVLFAANRLTRAGLGYHSLKVTFAEFDWPPKFATTTSAKRTAQKLKEFCSPELLGLVEVKLLDKPQDATVVQDSTYALLERQKQGRDARRRGDTTRRRASPAEQSGAGSWNPVLQCAFELSIRASSGDQG